MNTPSLPSECFQLIIEHLTLDGDVATLSTLLRVNKHVCGATLPFLYNNPFQPKFHQLEGYFPECALTSLKLAKSLLMTLPRESHTDLLTAAYQLPLDDEPRPCPVDYLSFVRHLNFDHCVFDYPRTPLDVSYNLGLEEFLKRRQKLTKGCARDRDGRYINGIPKLTILARRQLTSALCMPVLEQLQTMAIPLSDVHRYSGLVPRFRRLKNIVIKVENDRYLDQQVESIVKFVQRHTRLFKNQLQTAISPDDPAWPAIVLAKHPRYIYLRMLKLLPTMRNPTIIDETNWMPFMAKIDLISLEQVESIDAPVDASDWYDDIQHRHRFLQECRSLKHLQMVSLGPDMFKWAVREKRQKEKRGYHASRDHEQALVPLRSVIINNQMQPFQGELDDIAIGFGDTLSVFKVNGCRGAQEVGPLPPLNIGRRWNLPVLERLYICVGSSSRIVLDPAALCHCPRLETLEIIDYTVEYRCSDVIPCLPASMPRLRNMVLEGWASLTFHPETLRSTSNLTDLTLGLNCDGLYIPQVEELEASYSASISLQHAIQRPHWTWDWELPQLTTLTLRSEFAYRFQFCMLQGCPRLKLLILDVSTENNQHVREISKTDLYMSTLKSSPNHERIIVPSLRTLQLHGIWIVKDDLLTDFLPGMLPNLREVHALDMQGHTLSEWLRASKQFANLTTAYTGIQVTTEDALSHGLEEVCIYSLPSGRDRSATMYGFHDGNWVYFRK